MTEEVIEFDELKLLLEKMEDSVLLRRLSVGDFGLIMVEDMR